MSVLSAIRDRFRREDVSLQLDDIQALILRNRPEPYVGLHAMLHIDEAEGGRDLIARLAEHIPSAECFTEDLDAWTGVAISHAGLVALGVPRETLETFPLAFQQGMAARADILRDVGENAPEHWDEAYRDGHCHIALTIYAVDKPALDRAVKTAMAEFEASSGVTLLGTHEFGTDEEAKNPFGFRDGIAQPAIKGSGVQPCPGDQEAIAPGEFILGEDSETGSPLGIPQPEAFGRNGSYVVLRKYISRVGAFNDYLRAHAEDEEAQHLLAAKMFGRWRSGAPLGLAPERDDPELGADPMRNNDFDFSDDARGLMCPHSSHMRRMNPRDGKMTILTDVKIKRVVRRSSTFGPKWTPDVTAADDAAEDRGLFFIFISARAFDTIEFLQQEWVNRGNFIDLATERDPIVGLHEEPGQFTIPDEPARRRIDGITTFNRMAGGEYMFMPSLTGLKWLGRGDWA